MRRHTRREGKSNYNSLCIVGVIIGAWVPIMEVQRRLRIGRRELNGGVGGRGEGERSKDADGRQAGFAGAGKRMKKRTKGDGGGVG